MAYNKSEIKKINNEKQLFRVKNIISKFLNLYLFTSIDNRQRNATILIFEHFES